ncbi:hypothetical protein JWZ98_22700 (plasmid) [Methylomonas sp. EFPC1]|uniref:phage/plasmid replication protein n=1 Tax=Methylomonas sp. EFPC1 TaxID=2812647 RepID=UPI00196882ED|nr:phage/plasmid replication protein [Methylomonas sp. EFPC1]QSB03799.1 hypothetical protein JWZ98_22700 [Methylomonas sp. EFPC1]
MQVLKTFYVIGVYNPQQYDAWPWHCHYEDGQYLSGKYRVCGCNRQVRFESEAAAREFYFAWKRYKEFKFELIPQRLWVDVPDPVYPVDHPKSILKAITVNEFHGARLTGSLWLYGQDISTLYSEKTIRKHREILLKYGIDINEPLPDHLRITPEPAIIELEDKPKLTVIK